VCAGGRSGRESEGVGGSVQNMADQQRQCVFVRAQTSSRAAMGAFRGMQPRER
jgi:hypothetical protein